MRVTINDIAREAGISKTTVSLYLNRHQLSNHIADKTKQRIDQAVAALNYKPSSTARALSRGKTQMLGLVIGGIANEYFSHFAEATLEESMHSGYQLLVSLTHWNPDEELRSLETLLNQQVDGILYYPFLQKDSAIAVRLRQEEYPLVLVEQNSEDFTTVQNQITPALETAVANLRQRGHRRLVGVFGHFIDWSNAFTTACGDNGFTPELLPMPLSSQKEREAAADEICRLRPSALIINGRLTTNTLLRRIAETCPEYHPDIVINYDFHSDVIYHELVHGVIYCHSAQLVKTAVKTLVNLVEHKTTTPHRHHVPAEFILRQDFSARFAKEAEEQWQ